MPALVRSFLVAVAALLAALAPPASAAAPEPLALDEGWSHVPDPSDRGAGLGRTTGGGGGWREVEVPHVFHGGATTAQSFPGTIGWYKVSFEGPEADPGHAWAVRFGGVRRQATVWLNGRLAGGNDDPYTAFALTLDRLREGEENTLVVRVDNRKGLEPREGWWNWGGIVRPVELVPQGRATLESAAVLSDVSCANGGEACSAGVIVDGWVRNRTARVQRPLVDLTLRAPAPEDEQGAVVAQRTVRAPAVRPGQRLRLRFRVPVDGAPQLWSTERPALHDATVRTRLGGAIEDLHRQRVGLREVDVRGGLVRLNGRVVEMRGASIQEDVPGRGPALTDADVKWIVSELKAVDANVTRAHYLLDDRLLSALDEAGIMVWSQAPVYHRDALLTDPERARFELGVLRRTVLGGRRHASVMTHSVANELDPWPDRAPATGTWLRGAASLSRDLDPTLPLSLDVLSYPRVQRQATYDRFQLLGINSYYGWYEGKQERSTADLEDLGPYLRAMHQKYPRQALVITEFGAESTFSGPPDTKETYEFQERYVRDTLAIVDRLDFVNGAIYWTLREFAVKPSWDGGAERRVERDAIHNKGLIAYDGQRKPAWHIAEAMFSATPLYRDGRPRQEVLMAPVGSGPSALRGWGMAIGVLALLGGFVWLNVWALRGLLGTRRRRGDRAGAVTAEVMELRRVA
ncbi:MAG TPA: glycoside hydrolase family 2 TIM barrel-domain containing protein [Solirubrobacteraceae bacterium]|nr:glycoside hydrolase family 2 TIM barrel-domain containing protein [Solirubrobacteraceae bacterium]